MSVLVDTTVWSLALRRHKPIDRHGEYLFEMLNKKRAIIIGAIRQEILSGFRLTAQFTKLRDFLRDVPDLSPDTADYETAAEFYNFCLTKGVSGSQIDFLICAVAMRRDMEILTTDKDFDRYQKYLPIRLLKI